MSVPEHEIVREADTSFVVEVGRKVAGYISQDAERTVSGLSKIRAGNS